MDKNIILDVKNLSVRFPIFGGVFNKQIAEVRAVDGISFTLKEGEVMGMVGESGCGKTTTGRAIINIVRRTAPYAEIDGDVWFSSRKGEVNFQVLNKHEMRGYRKEIQMIFQDPYSSLNPRLTVGQIIDNPLKIQTKMKRQERSDRVSYLMEKVGLRAEQTNRYPHEFSGGQRQRIGIARALATNPRLVVADEPVSALDVSVQAQVINLMEDLQEEFKLTYIFIAHDLSIVKHIADRIAVMYLGDIVEIGNGDDIYDNPVHPYTKALISAVPLPDPKLAKEKRRIKLEGDVPNPLAKPSGCGFRTRCPIAKRECAFAKPELVQRTDGRYVACPWV